MSYSAESTAPRQALDVGRCFNDAMEVFQRNWLILAVAAMLYELLSLFSLLILAGPLYGGICLMLLEAFAREDKRVDLGDMFRCFDQFWPLLGLFVLTFLPLLIATAFCVVPGLLLGTLWLYPTYLIIDKDKGVFSSLGASKEIVMRKGFGMNLLVFVIMIALSLAPSAIPYVGFIVSWVVSPIGWLLITSAYIQQVHEDQGELADVLQPEPAVS